MADAIVFLSLMADIIERLGPFLEPDAIDAETISRLRDAIPSIQRKTASSRLTPTTRRTDAPHLSGAATGQNRGKTTVSLGVLDGFQRRGLSAGFMELVGQRTIIEEGVPADEDAVLMKRSSR